MTTYNGHKNWTYWNVSLWLNNDEGLYYLATDCIKHCRTKREAAQAIYNSLVECCTTQTPDGAAYTVENIRAAIGDM